MTADSGQQCAEAGTQSARILPAARGRFSMPWVPACAGMTAQMRAGMTVNP